MIPFRNKFIKRSFCVFPSKYTIHIRNDNEFVIVVRSHSDVKAPRGGIGKNIATVLIIECAQKCRTYEFTPETSDLGDGRF